MPRGPKGERRPADLNGLRRPGGGSPRGEIEQTRRPSTNCKRGSVQSSVPEAFPQLHARSAGVLGDKLDARRLKGRDHFRDSRRRIDCAAPGLKSLDGRVGQAGSLRQSRLRPA
jgi:hypothetical protein